MSSWPRLAVAGAVLGLGLAAAGAAPGEPAGGKGGASAMSSLELSLTIEPPAVLQGQCFAAVARLRNAGPEPVPVPDPNERPPLVFQLVSRADPDRVYSASWHRYELALVAASIKRAATVTVPLAPGAAIDYVVDLGKLLVEPLPPGGYQVIASLPVAGASVSASPRELEVRLPQPVALWEGESFATNQMITLLAHRDGARLAMLDRQAADGYLGIGCFVQRHELAGDASIAALTAAVNVERARNHWLGWLAGTEVGAAYGADVDLTMPAAAVAVGLEAARLVEAGRRLPDRSAAFFVVGSAEGALQMREFRYQFDPTRRLNPKPSLRQATPIDPNPVTRTLPFAGSKVPERLLARYVPEADRSDMDLLSVEVDGGEQVIRLRRYPGQGEPTAPKRLYASRDRLLALAMDPSPPDGAPAVADALFLAEDSGKARLVRIPLSGEAATEWGFEEPVEALPPGGAFGPNAPGWPHAQPERTAPGERPRLRPDQWAIARVVTPAPLVLAKLGDRVLAISPSQGGEPRVIAEGTRDLRFLRLHALYRTDRYKNRHWATWWDASLGAVRKPIRP